MNQPVLRRQVLHDCPYMNEVPAAVRFTHTESEWRLPGPEESAELSFDGSRVAVSQDEKRSVNWWW